MREILARLGVESLTAIIGRTDLLVQLKGITAKQQKLDLSPIIASVVAGENTALYKTEDNNPFDQGQLNQDILAATSHAIAHSAGGEHRFTIKNTIVQSALQFQVKLRATMAIRAWQQVQLLYI